MACINPAWLIWLSASEVWVLTIFFSFSYSVHIPTKWDSKLMLSLLKYTFNAHFTYLKKKKNWNICNFFCVCFESYYCLLQTNKCNNPNTNKCKQKNVYIFYLFLFIVKKKCQRKYVGCGWLDQMILHFRVILNAIYEKCIWCPKTFFLLCMKILFFLLPHHLEKGFCKCCVFKILF